MPHATLNDFQYDRIPQQHLQEAVEEVAQENGFKQPRFDVRPGSQVGDNYGSVLHRVTVTEEEGDDAGRQLLLMVKSSVESELLREKMKLYRAFRNEANFYSVILTSYTEMMRGRGILGHDEEYPEAPRCYLATAGDGADDDKDCLILQDMRPEGFKMQDRRKGQNVDHCRMVLNTVAHLHAASFAMEQLRPQEFERLRNSVQELFRGDIDFMKVFERDALLKNSLPMIEGRFPDGTIQHEKMVEHCNDALNNLFSLLTPSPDGKNVIAHGDCWINNMLFKYSEAGQVERVCLLDFQVARYASPVLDVVYFMYTCTEKAMRDEHQEALYRGYHTELQARMRLLGVDDPDALFSWQNFQEHLQRYSRFGLHMGLLAIPVFTADQDEAPDLKSRLEQGTDSADLFVVQCKDTKERDRRVSDLLEDLVARGFL